MGELHHIALQCVCEFCGGNRILSTWLDATYKYWSVTTCATCDAPSPDEPFGDDEDLAF